MTSSENTIHRVMHPIKHRQLTVLKVVDLTPRMRRITLGGEQLQGFVSLGSDDHVKLLFANNAEEQAAMDALDLPKDGIKPTMREYTPRRIDLVNNELDLDFVLHGDGPASTWAAQARASSLQARSGASLRARSKAGRASSCSRSADWRPTCTHTQACRSLGRPAHFCDITSPAWSGSLAATRASASGRHPPEGRP